MRRVPLLALTVVVLFATLAAVALQLIRPHSICRDVDASVLSDDERRTLQSVSGVSLPTYSACVLRSYFDVDALGPAIVRTSLDRIPFVPGSAWRPAANCQAAAEAITHVYSVPAPREAYIASGITDPTCREVGDPVTLLVSGSKGYLVFIDDNDGLSRNEH